MTVPESHVPPATGPAPAANSPAPLRSGFPEGICAGTGLGIGLLIGMLLAPQHGSMWMLATLLIGLIVGVMGEWILGRVDWAARAAQWRQRQEQERQRALDRQAALAAHAASTSADGHNADHGAESNVEASGSESQS